MRLLGLSTAVCLILLAAACAPAAGRPSIPYLAAPQEIISALAAYGPTITPPSGYNFFSIETIGDTFITLRADVTTGIAVIGILGGTSTPPMRLTITTLEQPQLTQVALSGLPVGRQTNDMLDEIVRFLDQRFSRAPVPGGQG